MLRVTACFGVPAQSETTESKGSLVAAADTALHRARRARKNRTERGGSAPRKTPPAIE